MSRWESFSSISHDWIARSVQIGPNAGTLETLDFQERQCYPREGGLGTSTHRGAGPPTGPKTRSRSSIVNVASLTLPRHLVTIRKCSVRCRCRSNLSVKHAPPPARMCARQARFLILFSDFRSEGEFLSVARVAGSQNLCLATKLSTLASLEIPIWGFLKGERRDYEMPSNKFSKALTVGRCPSVSPPNHRFRYECICQWTRFSRRVCLYL